MSGFIGLLYIIRNFVDELIQKLAESSPIDSNEIVVGWIVSIDGIRIILKEQSEIMAELREGQQIPVSVTFKTKRGKAARYEEGTAVWETSNPDVATVTVDPSNELSAVVEGVDGSLNESVVISFRADGDPDQDQVREVVATLDVTVTQGEAFVTELTAGPATDVVEETEDGAEDTTTDEATEGETPDATETPDVGEGNTPVEDGTTVEDIADNAGDTTADNTVNSENAAAGETGFTEGPMNDDAGNLTDEGRNI